MTEHEQMLMNILQCRKVDLVLGDYSLTDEQQEVFEEMKHRRDSGEPLQYVIGSCDFFGINFFVDKRVLIPRPETEILVEEMIRSIQQKNLSYPLSILDLGTGSGNISIALAKSLDSVSVTSVDVDSDALAVAKFNALYNHVEEKIRFFCGDMVNFLENTNERFDIIVSNPPYIPTSRLSRLPLDVKQEPRRALDGGQDGLKYYREIIKRAPKVLKEKGFIAFELGDGQDVFVENIFQSSQYFDDIRLVTDYVGVNRIILAYINKD